MKNRASLEECFLLLSCLLFFSCTRSSSPAVDSTESILSYAKGFAIKIEHGDTTLYVNTNPRIKVEIAKGTRSHNDTVLCIQTPPQRIVCLSTTHLAFLGALGFNEAIVGVAGGQFVTSPFIRTAIQSSKILDVGQIPNLDIEAIIQLQPDLVLGYSKSSLLPDYYFLFQHLNIPVLLCNEYLEAHPLGRSEWIKFFGYLLKSHSRADEIFDSISYSYTQLAQRSLNTPHYNPTVLLNLPWKGVWYIPSDSSYMSQLIRDAGAISIIGTKFHGTTSRALAIEDVIVDGMSADYWLHPSNIDSLNQLVKYRDFKSVIKKHVYNHCLDSEGNDFYESGVLLPHIILQDLLRIFHPEWDDTAKNPLLFYKELH